ncbi:MAG: hypothetical protein ABIQ13_00440 [Pedococcus sp.]
MVTAEPTRTVCVFVGCCVFVSAGVFVFVGACVFEVVLEVVPAVAVVPLPTGPATGMGSASAPADPSPALAGPALVAGLVSVAKAGESAFAGVQPEATAVSTTNPATAGQWRSGRRTMSRDRHFRSATSSRYVVAHGLPGEPDKPDRTEEAGPADYRVEPCPGWTT